MSFSFHRALRWVGVALFLLAVPAAVLVVLEVLAWRSPPGHLLNIVLALGTSLGTFGVNNDTALAGMLRAERSGGLVSAVAAELALERARRPVQLDAVHASPKAAVVFPLIASAAVLWLWHRAGYVG